MKPDRQTPQIRGLRAPKPTSSQPENSGNQPHVTQAPKSLAPAEDLHPKRKKPSRESGRVLLADYVPLATCELCRPHGGCFRWIRATSLMPGKNEEDPDLELGRTTIYGLMKNLINGVPEIEYSDICGKRLIDGASKCRYLKSRENRIDKRGGKRIKEKAQTPDLPTPVGPSIRGLVPPRRL
jgi:hypothetical protein